MVEINSFNDRKMMKPEERQAYFKKKRTLRLEIAKKKRDEERNQRERIQKLQNKVCSYLFHFGNIDIMVF